MRVYEFAKKHEVSSKTLISLLAEQGFVVSSHMAVLPDQALEFLNKKFKEKSNVSVQEERNNLEAKQGISHTPPVKESIPLETKPVRVAATQLTGKKEQYLEQAPKGVPEKKNQLTLQPYILSDLAELLSKTTSDLILVLLKWGILSSKNQQLSEELVERIAVHYEIPTIKKIEKPKDEQRVVSAASGGQLKERLPVVVVMGHVDHGKTTLLDFIRKSRVAAKEKGGITQHLGAYEAKTPQGDLVFIDTPGHEAFPKIRIRGTKVADLVILVVAADDGVMPQTIEALKHAQGMNVPIIVAINKIDKVDKARIDIVKRDLATQHNLLPEEWGGQTVYMPISAKTGAGIDKLLEMLVLQSQLMELKTEAVGPARGFILESKLEKGRGAVATVLTQHGILSVGDYFVAGKTTGKISSMVDSFGRRVDNVAASHPVQVAGFNELPEAGDYFEIVDKDTYLKTKNVFAGQKHPTLARAMNAENAVTLIVKTDTNSSKEALLESIGKLSKKSEKPFIILQSGIGNVTESDVMLAADTNSRIITLHVKAESNATNLAQRNEVSIHSFDIIYKLLEFLQDLLKSLEPVKTVKVKTGEAFVRKVFDIKNIGVIAGCYVKQGVLSRDGQVVIWRGSKKIGEGKILSLQRDKNTVKEVHAGFECAFTVEDFKDWQIDDRIECFVERAEQQPKKSN